ncbi:MAG: ethanolamine ammonia-lyase small subunit [Gammaproteobacteria bacterium]|nr:ethanolamine ammonia-lyase small subunit [Gammaproteobacteria bacterium]
MSRQDVDKSWQRFTSVTRARIALGRAGDALPTQHLLDFAYAHAKARDAVTARVNFDALAARLEPTPTVHVQSAAQDRSTYLRRPDLGRVLARDCADRLPEGPFDAVFVIADGLSANAVQTHAVPTYEAAAALLPTWCLGPVVLAEQARVALGDEIGERMGAAMVVMLIGERPGLSVPDSLGLYLTYAPHVGRSDAERNCISNIHADGLPYAVAAAKLAWLMSRARLERRSGVALKEDAPGVDTPGADTPGLAAPGLAAPGLAAPGLAATGLAAPGVAAPGLAATGLAARRAEARRVLAPGVVPPAAAQDGENKKPLDSGAAELRCSDDQQGDASCPE